MCYIIAVHVKLLNVYYFVAISVDFTDVFVGFVGFVIIIRYCFQHSY